MKDNFENKKNKFFKSIVQYDSMSKMCVFLLDNLIDIPLNDFILLSLSKNNNKINITYLEFFKQTILDKYKLCISSNELLKFRLERRIILRERGVLKNPST